MHSFLHFKDLIKSYFSGGVVCTLLFLLVSSAVNSKEIKLTVSSFGTNWSGYTEKTATISDIKFTAENIAYQKTGIQMRSSKNSILYNTTPIKGLKSIKITDINSANTNEYTVYGGTNQKPTKSIGTGKGKTTTTFNFNDNELYFELAITSSGIFYFSEIVITYDEEVPCFKLSQTSTTINAGETYDLGSKITKADGYKGTISYSSGDNNVATVSESGIITGVKKGTTDITIKASANGDFAEQSETFAITVEEQDLRKDPAFSWSPASYEPYFDTENKTFPTLNKAEGFNEAITYSSINENVATINANGEITILSAGETTITASFTGNNDWKESTASYTLNIKKHITELSFGTETTYNVNLGETFNSPKATAATKNNKEYDGTITYGSSDANIAEVNVETGDVEIKGAGTVTITATAAATEAWTEATASYTLNIVDPNNLTVTFDYTKPEELGITKPKSGTGTNITTDLFRDIVTMSSTNGSTPTRIWNRGGTCELCVYTNGSITYTVPEPYVITKIDFTYSGTYNKITTTIGSFSNDKKQWTGKEKSVKFNATDQTRIHTATITYKKLPTVTVTDKKYTTYVTPCAVDFGNEVRAYIVNEVTADKVKTVQVSNAPKGTPVIIYAEKADTYTLTEIEAATDDVTSNKLQASDGTVTGGNNIYAMAVKSKGAGFYKVSESVTIPAGKAYLVWGDATANSKEFIPIGGETTGITSITGEDGNGRKVYYNLNGMRVDNPQKGIYIVNGKKVIF